MKERRTYRANDGIVHVGDDRSSSERCDDRKGERRPYGIVVEVRYKAPETISHNQYRAERLSNHRSDRIPPSFQQRRQRDGYDLDSLALFVIEDNLELPLRKEMTKFEKLWSRLTATLSRICSLSRRLPPLYMTICRSFESTNDFDSEEDCNKPKIVTQRTLSPPPPLLLREVEKREIARDTRTLPIRVKEA